MRRSDKKGRARPPAIETKVALAGTTGAPTPSPRLEVPVPPKDSGSLPMNTDNPWRDLHPSRIWPD